MSLSIYAISKVALSKAQLTDNVVTNLQGQIDTLREYVMVDDEVVAAYDSTQEDGLNGLFSSIRRTLVMMQKGVGAITLTITFSDNTPIEGVQVSGFVDEDGSAVTLQTNAKGIVTGYVLTGSQTLSLVSYADFEGYSKTYTIVEATHYTDAWILATVSEKEYTGSTSLMFSSNCPSINMLLVGGGGGGGSVSNAGDNGGGGGGGGYVTTKNNVPISSNEYYQCIVGSGGAAGGNGGSTSFAGFTAKGGNCGNGRTGGTGNGNGGTGGKNVGTSYTSATDGIDGSDGYGGGGGGGAGLIGKMNPGSSGSGGSGGSPYGGKGGSRIWKSSSSSYYVEQPISGSYYGGGGGGGTPNGAYGGPDIANGASGYHGIAKITMNLIHT